MRNRFLAGLLALLACASVQATTATGQCSVNYAVLGDANPWTNADYTVSSGGTTRIVSGLLRPNATGFFYYSGAAPSYNGGAITVSAEVNAAATDDEVYLGSLDENGDGIMLEVGPTAVFVLILDNYVVIDSAGTAATTLTADDLYSFTMTKGSPNTYSATKNGVPLSLSQTSYSIALGTMRATWSLIFGNVGASAVKSLAVVAGLTGNCGGGGSLVPVIYQTLRQQKK